MGLTGFNRARREAEVDTLAPALDEGPVDAVDDQSDALLEMGGVDAGESVDTAPDIPVKAAGKPRKNKPGNL